MMSVVAMSALLSGIVLMSQRSSEAALRDACQNNLRNLALGVSQYSITHGAFPAGTIINDRLPPDRRLSWLVEASAFMDQWRWLFDLALPWDAGINVITRGQGVGENPQVVGRVSLFTCPAAAGMADDHMPGWTWYVGIAGVGPDAPELPSGHPRTGVFGYDRQTRVADIKDGAANTVLLAETDLVNGPWTAGGTATVRGLDPSQQPYIGLGRQFGGLHRGGVMVAMADGSVRFLREGIDPTVFEAVSTVAGGERLPEGWDRSR